MKKLTIFALVALLLVLALPAAAQTPKVITFTIKADTSITGPIYLEACTIAGIEMPTSTAGWDTAVLTFQKTVDGSTYREVKDEYGTAKSITAAAGDFIYVSPADWWFSGTIKIRSGTAALAVTQTADRTIKIVCR